MWGVPSRLLEESEAAAPYLDAGYVFTAAAPDLGHGISPLCSSAAQLPLAAPAPQEVLTLL